MMLFIEIILSTHLLLWMSSLLIGGRWLTNSPSFKLKLSRLLLISCVLSPLIVHCIHPVYTPERHHYVSFDTLQEYVNQPLLSTESVSLTRQSTAMFTMSTIKYYQLFYVLLGILIVFRGYPVLLGLGRLRAMLADAVPYRTCGKLVIKVSHRCHIPFSVYLFNKAYIVLPVSLLSSVKNMTIAIAHEGQHHRNGDCLWAYVIEALRIIFIGNPGISRWHRVLNELQELSCDEVLVGQPKISPHDYGYCLFEVVQAASQSSLSSNREIACTVGMALSKQSEDCTFIIRRISMLPTYPPHTSRPLLGMVLAGLSILAPIGVAYSAAGSLTSSTAGPIDISHLNPRIQNIAEKEITAAVKRYQAKSGVIAIADPTTGNIIAFAEASNNKNEGSWTSRVFSPGSTIKPFIAAAAIDAGSSSPTKNYDCPSPYYLEGKQFTNYDPNTRSASLTEAITKSINICFIKVSQEAGAAVIRKKLTEFGFDMNSWWQAKHSDDSQLAMTALGENIPVTIESLTKSYAILAHKGRSFDNGERAIIASTTTDSIQHMLERVVTQGTGVNAAIPNIAVAGKTGTVIENKEKHLALFAGYAPAGAPRYVMLVVIEDGHLTKNGKVLTSGGELAAPVFRHVAIDSLKNI